MFSIRFPGFSVQNIRYIGPICVRKHKKFGIFGVFIKENKEKSLNISKI